ncbi:MAG: hypothetical protein NTX07_07725 [Solirubrobacterales bacterium]|nr:hypothetical protein [Solirubrobacterales bacterium]
MARVRSTDTATRLKNGNVLISGGKNSDVPLLGTELYNTANGTFTSTGDMSAPHIYGVTSLLANGKVLIAGGCFADYSNTTVAELYDPSKGTFKATGSLTPGLNSASSAQLPNGKVLIVGGYDGTSDVTTAKLYDPATGVFSTSAGRLTDARDSARAVMLKTGKVLIAGGGNDGTALTSAELYTPTPPAKPGKPVVKWATNKKKRLVTATVNLVNGTTYKLTAKLGRKTKNGKCKTKGAKVVCTLAPGKGKWKFSITPHNLGGNGPANGKAIKL